MNFIAGCGGWAGDTLSVRIKPISSGVLTSDSDEYITCVSRQRQCTEGNMVEILHNDMDKKLNSAHY